MILLNNRQQKNLRKINVKRLKVWNLMFHYIIYKTTNKINGHFYVGIHRERKDKPSRYIGCGIEYMSMATKNFHFHNAVRKYGYENFVREILFTYPDTEEGEKAALRKEAEIVTWEFIKRPDTYNMALGGKMPPYRNDIKVAQYSLEGKFIKHYNSIKEASLETDVSTKTIRKCCKEEIGIRDFQWRFYNGDDSDISAAEIKTKVVYQFDLQGNLITWHRTAYQAEKKTGINHNEINDFCNGKRKGNIGGYY